MARAPLCGTGRLPFLVFFGARWVWCSRVFGEESRSAFLRAAFSLSRAHFVRWWGLRQAIVGGWAFSAIGWRKRILPLIPGSSFPRLPASGNHCTSFYAGHHWRDVPGLALFPRDVRGYGPKRRLGLAYGIFLVVFLGRSRFKSLLQDKSLLSPRTRPELFFRLAHRFHIVIGLIVGIIFTQRLTNFLGGLLHRYATRLIPPPEGPWDPRNFASFV